jgi:hypothetical protein
VGVLVSILGGGCRSDPSRVAEVAQAIGAVERQPAAAANWIPAHAGDGLALGSALRTDAKASAVLTLGPSSRLQVRSSTTVRFVRAHGRPFRLDVDTGAVEIEATGDAIEIETSLGTARLDRGAVAHFEAGRLEVTVGHAVLEREGRAVPLGARPEPAAAPDAGKPAEATITVRVRGPEASVRMADGWKKLAEGEQSIVPGARLRVGEHTSVEIARGDAIALVAGSAEVTAGTETALVIATAGRVSLRSGGQDARIEVPGGAIVASGAGGGSEATALVDPKRKRSQVAARRGELRVAAGQAEETLHAGESLELYASGRLEMQERAPSRIDFSVDAGQTVVVHDPRPPAAVRVRFGKLCPGEGTLELPRPRHSSGLAVGSGAANLLLQPGPHPYRVHCTSSNGTDTPRAEGRITIIRDSARALLPRRPPANVVDADGRSYDILYQSLPPEVTMRWSGAPAARSYVLHLEPNDGKARDLPAPQPSLSFKSGELSEGVYRFWFVADNGGRTPPTRMTIEFDNAAPTASIRSLAQQPDGALRVEFTVAEGWTVTAAEKTVPTDRSGRFAASLRPDAGEEAVALRLSHPKHGAHVYLLRRRP